MLTSGAITVGTAVTKVAQAGGSPLLLDLHNESGQSIYLGQSNVTTSTGFHLDQHEHYQIHLHPGNSLYAISGNTATLIVMGQQL